MIAAACNDARPPEGVPAPPPHVPAFYQPLVEYRGLLPEPAATFLGRLSDAEKREVYVILGVFPEIRGLLGTARLLHTFLKDSPDAASRGRTTFGEVLDDRFDILSDIDALRHKINRVAENICLTVPRVPLFKMEEVRRVHAAHRRVS
jgi:hypothetical protein